MSKLTPIAKMGAAVSLASMALAPVASANDAILAHIMDSEHIFHGVSERFMERLDELSGGGFTISYHPGGDLGDWTSIIEQVAQGSVEMTIAWNHGELDPRWDISNLAFIAEDWEQGEAVFGPGSTMEAVYQDILGDLNMVLLGVIPTDFTGFVVRDGTEAPVNFPEDAQGFKMRVPAQPLSIESYSALGFSVVPMAFSEVHTALQTGAIDTGTTYPVENAYVPPLTSVPIRNFGGRDFIGPVALHRIETGALRGTDRIGQGQIGPEKAEIGRKAHEVSPSRV